MLSLQSRQITRLLIYGFAAFIIVGSLMYSNYLRKKLAEKEQRGVRLYADAIDFMGNFQYNDSSATDNCMGFILSNLVLGNDSLVPLILIGEEGDTTVANIDLGEDTAAHARRLRSYIREFAALNEPIKVEFDAGRFQYVYYGESFVLTQLRWFPVIQLLLAFSFIGVVFVGFAIAKRNEQNRVWVGLAKETAHQLGTPVSSLMAWVELLKLRTEDRPDEQELIEEMEQDIQRLEDIAERFSKIGSQPELIEVSLKQILDRSAEYLRKRMTKRGSIQLHLENELPADSKLMVNPQLFDWVIENLLKNALDAIQSHEGSITLHAGERSGKYFIDVTDTGKGIAKGHFTKVFEPGFTTKKRGWGLGLSLTKRIVENYHGGKIFVKASEPGKGTTFRIYLPKPV